MLRPLTPTIDGRCMERRNGGSRLVSDLDIGIRPMVGVVNKGSPHRGDAAANGSPPGAVREVAWVFLKLGVIAFGGPAAHTAMMRDELVRRRGWISDERFVDLIGATNLIPGPNSTVL